MTRGWVGLISCRTGWTETGSTTATYLVRFYVNSCIPVVPEAPDVVQATCTAGEVTVPTITPKVTGFVTYTLDPTGRMTPGPRTTR